MNFECELPSIPTFTFQRFKFGGRPMDIIQAALDGDIEIAISEPIIAETLRILRAKFGWEDGKINNAISIIDGATIWVMPLVTLNAVEADPDDNRIIECAVTSGSKAIVSGDKHLLRLQSYKSILMISVDQALSMLRT